MPDLPDRTVAARARAEWSRTGARVRVAPLTSADIEPLIAATLRSAESIGQWNPVDPDTTRMLPQLQGDQLRTFVVHALDLAAGDGVVARVNLSGLVRGRLNSATLGYDAFVPYSGRGLTREGLRLVLEIAFAVAPAGLALHRVEAGVNPGNTRSALLLRGLGFRYEGRSARLLWLPGGPREPHRLSDWRDHDRYALLADEPRRPWRPGHATAPVVLVAGSPEVTDEQVLGSADRLARDLVMPVLRLSDLAPDAAAEVIRRCHGGVVIATEAGEVPEVSEHSRQNLIEVTLAEPLDDHGVARLASAIRARMH